MDIPPISTKLGDLHKSQDGPRFFLDEHVDQFDVLLVKIGRGPGAGFGIPSIIIETCCFSGGSEETPLFSSTNQWEKDIYDVDMLA